ncbi:hypothetical protein PN466_03285 [Roseofilum reptotaenium CS-1145]|uniref:Uncharacterized protein n=1 Tax=Roseofilum reptotaenium AO1-A TaxID=1925591 RepID=A0A1L9QMC2_9CYAN|nr:hypothetical protein [Roseofilum reptotaenium]MDB9515983.1 hypothetical protein [Roseofilum reptotaenium CS-1145]OJJ21904.1 hypothetical protein BI308_20085 [Roseofilum reptotaenium AO1-A]
MTWKRNTSGFIKTPPKWKSDPKTKAVRIPVSLAEEILAIAHQIDDERAGNGGSGSATYLPPRGEDKAIGDRDYDAAIAILKDSLLLKANAGGKIKAEIKKALELLEGN